MFWSAAGNQNTDATIELALKKAVELNIKYMVAASHRGETVKKILKHKPDINLICVTHHNGFKNPGENDMDIETHKFLEGQGVKVLTTTHLFAGVDRAIRNQFGGVYPAEIMAQTLRIFGQGVKVAVEIASMALDAGMIPYDEEIIALGGSGTGADSAIVIEPAHSNHFFQTQVKEIICMPRNKKPV